MANLLRYERYSNTVYAVRDGIISSTKSRGFRSLSDRSIVYGPFYLEQIEVGESVMQNIDRLCFHPKAPLRQEFDNLYGSLFKKSERHVAVIEALAKKNERIEPR